MVTTRSQSSRNFQTENINMDRTSDNESEASFPDILSREQMTELDSNNLLNDRNNIEKNMIDQRFYEMNRQIGELTALVLALTQRYPLTIEKGMNLSWQSLAPIVVPTACVVYPGFRSLRICADLQDFCRSLQICADMQNFCRSLQLCADSKKTDVLRNTIKTPQRCQTNNDMFKTGEKSHLCQNDKTFFCSNM